MREMEKQTDIRALLFWLRDWEQENLMKEMLTLYLLGVLSALTVSREEERSQ